MKNARLLLSGLSLLTVLAGCAANPSGLAPNASVRSFGHLQARALPTGYYAAAEGKTGRALVLALNAIVKNHKDLGYDGARDAMFGSVDDADNDNTVQDIYLGRSLPGITDRGSAYKNGDGMNAEHTWPQSKGAEGVAKADLHHLFPADIHANSTRSSFPFGVVKSASWAEGGSQLGVDAAGNTVFEPRDPQKGNTARAIFYFYTVYGVNGGVDLENFRIEEDTLRRWNQQDPPDAAELRRNDLVFAAQGNRNPFVDHPEWINAAGEFMDQAQKLRRGR